MDLTKRLKAGFDTINGQIRDYFNLPLTYEQQTGKIGKFLRTLVQDIRNHPKDYEFDRGSRTLSSRKTDIVIRLDTSPAYWVEVYSYSHKLRMDTGHGSEIQKIIKLFQDIFEARQASEDMEKRIDTLEALKKSAGFGNPSRPSADRSETAVARSLEPKQEIEKMRKAICDLKDEADNPVSDRSGAMRYGIDIQNVFARATASFTDHIMSSAAQMSDVEASFDRLIANLTGVSKNGNAKAYNLFGASVSGTSPKGADFLQIREGLDDLGARLHTALDQVLGRYDDVASAASLFETCAETLEAMIVKGKSLCAQAEADGADYAPDLAESVASLAMTGTVSEIQRLTVARVLETERQAVSDLRRLTMNTVPLLQTHVAAAAALEREQRGRSMTGKAGTLERMAVASHPMLTRGADAEVQLQDLRDQLVQQFTQARDTLAGVKVNLEEARTLVLKQAGSATPGLSGASGHTGNLQYEAG